MKAKIKRLLSVNPSTLSIFKYIQKSLTQEELESFVLWTYGRKYDFLDRAIVHYGRCFLTCSRSEAKAKIHVLIDRYRNLPARDGYEVAMFLEEFKQFLGPEARIGIFMNHLKANAPLYFFLEILLASATSAMVSLMVLKILP